MLNFQLCSKFLSLPDFVICWKIQRLLEMPYCRISYDVAVIQWIMSCHKNRMTTLVITLARRRNVIDNVPINNAFSSYNIVHFKALYVNPVLYDV